MKKFIFYIILIAITFSFIELGSWSTIKVYQLIKHPEKNTDIQYEAIQIVDGQPLSNFREYNAFYGWSFKDITSKNFNVKNNLRKTKKTRSGI